MEESCNTQNQKGQERKESPKSKVRLVESREELDESERDPGDRLSNRLSESAKRNRRVRSEEGNPKSGTLCTI